MYTVSSTSKSRALKNFIERIKYLIPNEVKEDLLELRQDLNINIRRMYDKYEVPVVVSLMPHRYVSGWNIKTDLQYLRNLLLQHNIFERDKKCCNT